jgi:hypothetical protein
MAIRYAHQWALLIVFAVSRSIYYYAGIRFNARPLDKFFQMFDPVLLKDRLFETLFYAHTQPPGFNLMAACLLKLFPDHFAGAAHVLYLGLGVVILLSLFELMRILGVGANLAAIATALFIVSPGMVLFENLLIYEYPLFALLLLAAVCWYRLFERPSTGVAMALFSLMMMLAMIRSLFHLFYLVLAVAIVVYAFPRRRKQLLLAATLPVALVFGVYLKNWIMYGQFTSSTWLGFAIYTVTTHHLTPAEMDRFIAEGAISPVERVEILEPISAYSAFITPEPRRGIPVLDQELDSTGRPNFNNAAYFQLHRIYLADGKYLLKRYPVVYLRSTEKALFTYFLPTTDFPYFKEARANIRGFDRWVNAVVFGQIKDASNRKDLRAMENRGTSILSLALYTGIFLMIGLPLLFLYGCWLLWKGLKRESWTTPGNALLAFMLFHILMITALVNLLSSFENNRYRLPIDGFFLVLAAVATDRILSRRNSNARVPGGEVGRHP